MQYQEREQRILAPYAMHAAASAGRQYEEPAHPYRSPYQRDRDRIVHSSAYRRLAHKTQVFTGSLGDYHRTRLTHTLEVASVARTLARALRINEDLVETLALAHDIGHPPFGHAGEGLLNERLSEEGGFNHNAQALRIVEKLEQRYPEFNGLNLTVEVLVGQQRRANKTGNQTESPLLEVQVVDAADSIAYDAHDADDALELELLEFEELEQLTLWSEAASRVRLRYAALSGVELRRATVHELLDHQVSDLLTATTRRLEKVSPASVAEITSNPLLVSASPELEEQKRLMERFLFERVYRHPLVLSHRDQALGALSDLLDDTLAEIGRLPSPFGSIAAKESPLRAAADYVSSVTDRFALERNRAVAGKA